MTKKNQVSKSQGRSLEEYRVHMGAFDFEVIIIVGNYKQACKRVAWKFDDKDTDLEAWDMGYEPRGKCFFRRGYVPIVWIPRRPQSPREHATFAHEALHAVYHLFEWANLPLTRDTEEVMTHSMAHIVASLPHPVKKQVTKGKRT